MHWVKIPLMVNGKYVFKEEVDKIRAIDSETPIRLLRIKQKDGSEVLQAEKFVSDSELV